MRPTLSTLTLCLVIVYASSAACQYEDSFEAGGASPQEQESGSQESDDGDEVEDGDSGEDADGSGARDDEGFTTIVYGNDEETGREDPSETTTVSRLQDRFGNYPLNRQPPALPADEARKHVSPSGSAYIHYRAEYGPYFGRYFGQPPRRYYMLDKPPYGTPESPNFNPSSHALPDNNRLGHGIDNDQFEMEGGSGASATFEDLPSEDQIPPGENFDYLRKLRNMVIMSRLNKHYGVEMHSPFAGPQPSVQPITHVVSLAAHSSTEAPKPKVDPAIHNLTQVMSDEMETLRGRLRSMEIERIKLRTILIQLKSILNEMHERSTSSGTSGNIPSMSQHEMRIARLRNLFVILNAVTRLTPLRPDELEQINYDVGLFDPKITDESKTALINRMTMILHRKTHNDDEDNGSTYSGPNEPIGDISKASMKDQGQQHSQSSPGMPLHLSGNSVTPSATPSAGDETHDRRSLIQCKLRRLRNLYLLVRPFVTGTKLTREELREIFQSHEGFFEPGLTETQKVALVSKMAETIRMAHFSRQLILNSSSSAVPSTSPVTSSPTSTSAPAITPPSGNLSPVPPFVRPSLLIITQRLNDEPSRAAAPPSDKMHVSGKIQMDLNIEGDVDPAQEGLLSKLL